ncbi:unnamed protein product [Calicophoron daubneyi]|uniref:Beta-1,4-galactosyltransferase n=1 Tax=Calicophoron daubneyi TaxID=300641 RepID=A0AAV2TWK6_CALDB
MHRHLRFRSRRFWFKPKKVIVYGLLIILLLYLYGHYRHSRVLNSDPVSLLAARSCPNLGEAKNSLCCPVEKQLPLIHSDARFPPSYTKTLTSHQEVCRGSWTPSDCLSQQKVAILIPYRNRDSHLLLLLARLHDLLPHQKIAYTIYVIEQDEDTPFNRGLLLNIGMRESTMRDPAVNCFIYHDVDLLPENSDNLYLCDSNLHHLASGINEDRFHVPFENYAGGVTALSRENAELINGFPNRYWGWGNEDDELAARAFLHKLYLSRSQEYIGRYKAVRHVKSSRGSGHYTSFLAYRGFQNDGLTTLQNGSYKVIFDSSNPSATTRLSHASVFRVMMPLHLNICVLRSPSWYSNIPEDGYRLKLHNLTAQSRQLESAARSELFVHIKVNVTELYHTVIKPERKTRESFWWFLQFFGWL